MSFESLHLRLVALQESVAQLRDLISRLADLPFTPGALPVAVDEDGSPGSELNGEIGALMRGGLEEQQNLLEEIKFVRLEGADKRRFQEGIVELGLDLTRCRAALRKARLSAKQNLVRAQRTERELIIRSLAQPALEPPAVATSTSTLASISNPITRTHARAQFTTAKDRERLGASLSEKDRHTVNASSSLTAALQRTHSLMTAELTRSEFAHQMLAESSEALASLDASYTSLDGMLSSSRALLGTLLRTQKSDTWYLQTARWMLLGTLVWLVFRRLLYGPMWWVVYLPLRIVFGVTWGAGRAVMEMGGGGGGGSGGGGEKGHGLQDVGDGSRRTAVDVDGLPDDDLPTIRVVEEENETVVVVMEGEPNVIREEDVEDARVAKGGAVREGEPAEASHSRDEL